MKAPTDRQLLWLIIIGLIVLWVSAIKIANKYMKEPDQPKQADTYDWRIYKPIESDNPDSLMMMCYVRNTKASRDSIWRMKVGL